MYVNADYVYIKYYNIILSVYIILITLLLNCEGTGSFVYVPHKDSWISKQFKEKTSHQ